jgi:hypothetical protein
MGDTTDHFGIHELLAAAGCHVPKKPIHALRHTFASHYVMGGGKIEVLQRLLGHATIAMTMRYAHLAPDYLGAEVARLSFPSPKPQVGVSDLGEERRKRAAATADGPQLDQEANMTLDSSSESAKVS